MKKITTTKLGLPEVMCSARGCLKRLWGRTFFFALTALCLWPSVAAVSELRLNLLVKPPADRNLNWQQLFQAYNYQLDLRKNSGNETFPSVEERKNFEEGVGSLNPAPSGVAVTFDTSTFAFGTPVTARFSAVADPAQLITRLCLRDENWLSLSLFMQAPAPFQQGNRCIEVAPALQSVALDLTFALPPGFTSGRFSLVAYDDQGLSTVSPVIPVIRTDYSGAQLTLASATEMNKGDKTSGQLSLLVDSVALSSVLGNKVSYTLTSASPSVVSVGLTSPNIADIEVPTNAPVSGDTPVPLSFSASLNGVTLASGTKTITVKDQVAYRWGVPAYSYSYVSPSGTWTLDQARRGYKIKVTSFALDSANVPIDGDDHGYSFSATGSNLTLVNGSKRNEKIVTINGADQLHMQYLGLAPETMQIAPTNFMDTPALTLNNWAWVSGNSGSDAAEVFGSATTPEIRRGDNGKSLMLTFNETYGGLGGSWAIRSLSAGLTATIQSQTPTSVVLSQIALSDAASLAANIELRRTDSHGNTLDVTVSGTAGEKIVQARWGTSAFTFSRLTPIAAWDVDSIYEGYRGRIKLNVETDEITSVPVVTGNFNLSIDNSLATFAPTATASEFEVEFASPGVTKITGHYQDASGQAAPLSTSLRGAGFNIKELPVYKTTGSLSYVRQAGLSANKQEAAPTTLANKQGTVLKGVTLYPGDDGFIDFTLLLPGTAIDLDQWLVVGFQGLDATPALNLTTSTGQEKITLDLKISNTTEVADGYKINLVRKDSHGNEFPVTIEGQLLDFPELNITGLTNLTMTDSELQNLTLGVNTSANVTAVDFNWQYSLTDVVGAYANTAIQVTPDSTEKHKAVIQVGSIPADGEVELTIDIKHKQQPAFTARATSRIKLDIINITATFDFNAAVSNLIQPDRSVDSMGAAKLLSGDIFTVKAQVMDENGNELTLSGQTTYQWKVFFKPTGGNESETSTPTGTDVSAISVPTQIAGIPVDDGTLRVELKVSYSYGSKTTTSTLSKTWSVNEWPVITPGPQPAPTALDYQNTVRVDVRSAGQATADGDVDYYWRLSKGNLTATDYGLVPVSFTRNYGSDISFSYKTTSKTATALTIGDVSLVDSDSFGPVTVDIILFSKKFGVYSRNLWSRTITYKNTKPVIDEITVTPLEGFLAIGKKVRLSASISDPDHSDSEYLCNWQVISGGDTNDLSNFDNTTCAADFLISTTNTVIRLNVVDDLGQIATAGSPERTLGTSTPKDVTIIANYPPEFFDNSPLVALSDFGSGMPSQMRLIAFDRDGDQLSFDILPYDISGDNNCDFSKPLPGGQSLTEQSMVITQEDISVGASTVKKQVATFNYTHINSNTACLKVVVKDNYGQTEKNISLPSNLLPEFRRVFIDGVYTAGRATAGPIAVSASAEAVFKEEAEPPQLVVFANITDMDSAGQADLSMEAIVTKDGASPTSDFNVTWDTEITTTASSFSTYVNTRCDPTSHYCFNGMKAWNGMKIYGVYARVIITLDSITSTKSPAELDSLLGKALIVELIAKDSRGGSRVFKVRIPRLDALSFRTNAPFWKTSSAMIFTPATLGAGYQLRLPYFLESNTDLGYTQNQTVSARVALGGPSSENSPLTPEGIESHAYYKFRINEPTILNWYDSTVTTTNRFGSIYKLDGSSLTLVRDSLNNNGTDTLGNSNRYVKLQAGAGGNYNNGYDWRTSLPIQLDGGTYYIRRMFNKSGDVVMNAGNYFSTPITGYCPATGKVDNHDLNHTKGVLPHCFSANRPRYVNAASYSYPTVIRRSEGKVAVTVFNYTPGHALEVQDADYPAGQDAKLKVAYIQAGSSNAVSTDFNDKIYIDPSKIAVGSINVYVVIEDESGLMSAALKNFSFQIVD